ncbi:hypothetical protein ACQEU3_08810 [Spirillospora sp. CA-253888]
MVNDDVIVAELRRRALKGDPPSVIAAWLVGRIGSAGSFFRFLRYFFEAYVIPVQVLRGIEGWVGFEWGKSLSDADLDQLLSPLKVRDVSPVDGHDAGGRGEV